MFEIKKGTKQGDPLSGLLFNTVLQNSLKEVTQRWQKKKGLGIYLSDHDHESVRYLDQWITFQQQETTEIKNRIRAAWATFHKYRQELTSKNYLFKHRFRLFDAAITPTICYASGTWAPTKEHERMIQSTQRKMLRLTFQTKRRYKRS